MELLLRLLLPALLALNIQLNAAPAIQAVVNAASYTAALAPGGLASVFGTDLASGVALPATPLPVLLDGVSVSIAGIPCPITLISPTQINVFIPFEVASPGPGQRTSVSVVVNAPDGTSPAFNVTLSRAAPALFSQNDAGNGAGLVFDTNFRPATSIGTNPVIFYATGLGPVNDSGQTVDAVSVLLGDNPATVLYAGIAPGLTGVYQINVAPQNPISDRLAIFVDSVQSNFVTLPIDVGDNLANLSASIDGLYPATGAVAAMFDGLSARPVTFSEMLFAGQYTFSIDLAPGAKPFDIVARCRQGTNIIQKVINIDPAAGRFTSQAPAPTQPERGYDFSALGHTVIDFENDMPFPYNIVPVSRVDPIAISALQLVALPSLTSSIGDNQTVEQIGPLPGAHIDSTSLLDSRTFGGFTTIQSQHGGATSVTFELFIDGVVAASKSVSFTVD